MKQIFAFCALLSIVMFVYAEATLTHSNTPGLVNLRWSTDDNPARTVQIKLFDELHKGVSATVDPAAFGDSSKLIVQCSTGTGPDIIDVGSSDQMQSLVDAGVLLDLTPYAKSMGFDPSHTFPAIKSDLEVAGKQYRFPDNVNADAIVYNKAIFDDHGVPYPKPGWTYDDFRRTAKLILERPSKSGQTHLAVANWGNVEFYEDLLIGHGGRLFSPDGLHSALDSPESIAAMQDYYNMMYVDKIIQTPADSSAMSSQGGWGSGALNWFSEGKAAMTLIARWYTVQVPNYPAIQGHLGACTLPRVGNRPSAGIASTRAAGINVRSSHRQEALQFLRFLASPQYSSVIVQDGDGLPPNPKLAISGKDLVNEQVPDPAYHEAFIEAIKNAQPLDFSPYVDASEVTRWITEYVQKVENKIATPDQAMHGLAAQIDQQIRINLERRPDLQRLYEQRTGKKYSPDWS